MDYHIVDDEFLDNPVASSMECTGLIPALPQTEAELESYEKLIPFLTPPAPKNSDDTR